MCSSFWTLALSTTVSSCEVASLISLCISDLGGTRYPLSTPAFISRAACTKNSGLWNRKSKSYLPLDSHYIIKILFHLYLTNAVIWSWIGMSCEGFPLCSWYSLIRPLRRITILSIGNSAQHEVPLLLPCTGDIANRIWAWRHVGPPCLGTVSLQRCSEGSLLAIGGKVKLVHPSQFACFPQSVWMTVTLMAQYYLPENDHNSLEGFPANLCITLISKWSWEMCGFTVQ